MRKRLRAAALAGLACCAFGAPQGAAGEVGDRPAVELYNPAPAFPARAASVDVVPDVTVEVEVDELGKVRDVRVVEVRPSSELDFLFEEAMVSTLSTWRYAPRIENGAPVSTTLRWTQTQFGRAGDEPRRLNDREWWNALAGLAPRGGDRFRAMPVEDRRKLLEDEVGKGLAMMRSGSVTRAVGEQVVVYTDAGEETARIVGANVQAATVLLSSLLAEDVALEPEELALQVLVFSDDAAFHGFSAQALVTEKLVAGFYSQLGLLAFHLEVPTPDDALAVMLHEATHAFVDRRVVRGMVTLPAWLTEGLAEYVASSKVDKGRLVPGKIRRAPTTHLSMVQGEIRVAKGGEGVAATLATIREAARRGRSLTLAQMLDADRETFHGEERRLYYGSAGLLVHFLRHGAPGWEGEPFSTFLLYVAEGFPPSAALEVAYDTPVAALEESFRSYLAHL